MGPRHACGSYPRAWPRGLSHRAVRSVHLRGRSSPMRSAVAQQLNFHAVLAVLEVAITLRVGEPSLFV